MKVEARSDVPIRMRDMPKSPDGREGIIVPLDHGTTHCQWITVPPFASESRYHPLPVDNCAHTVPPYLV